MRAIVSPDDLKVGELVEPSWYPCELADYSEKEAGTDKSTNCIFRFKIIDGKYAGYSAKSLFNEKSLGMGKKLWAALGLPFDDEKGYLLSTELFEQQVGKKLKVYIKRGKSNQGNEFNDPADFAPLT
jgi:hypothetical protein